MVLKEDLESLANPSNHPENILKAVFYHPNNPEAGVDYQLLFIHLGACKFCRELVSDERERNPFYQEYVQAVENGRINEYRAMLKETAEEFKHKG